MGPSLIDQIGGDHEGPGCREWIDIRITQIKSQLSVYVNGEKQITANGLTKDGTLMCLNLGGEDASIKINSYREI